MIRILIADDHAIVRAGLKQLLQDQPDMAVAAEASSGADALAVVRAEDIDVMLLDISMPDRNGIDVLKSARHHKPDLPVLVLSGYPEEQYAINLIRAGAAGYINKEAAPDQLLKAIRTVAAGRRYISARLAEILAEGISRISTGPCIPSCRSGSSRCSAGSPRARRCRGWPMSCACR